MAHNHTIKSESYSMGMLPKKIYRMDATLTLFQRNKDSNAIKVRFEQSLAELTHVESIERHTVTQFVHTLKVNPILWRLQTCASEIL